LWSVRMPRPTFPARVFDQFNVGAHADRENQEYQGNIVFIRLGDIVFRNP
jgi:hypothetical protein